MAFWSGCGISDFTCPNYVHGAFNLVIKNYVRKKCRCIAMVSSPPFIKGGPGNFGIIFEGGTMPPLPGKGGSWPKGGDLDYEGGT